MKNETTKRTAMLEKRGAEIMRVLVKDNMNTISNFNSVISVAKKVKSGKLNPNHSKEVQQEFIDKYAMSENVLKELERVKELLAKVVTCYYGDKNESK